jgi:hydrogenase-4 component E
MVIVLIVLFAATLIYFFLSERVANFIWLLSVQGALLFGIAFNNLIHIQTLGLIVILLETLIVKAIVIPWFLNRLRHKNQLKRVHESKVPVFYSLILISAVLIGCFLMSYTIDNEVIQLRFFTVALATVIGGMYFIVIHKNIFSHLVGFLIIENGAFLLSLAVGGEMPFLVSLAVLLDVLIAVLVIGVFMNKVRDTFDTISASKLSQLKD